MWRTLRAPARTTSRTEAATVGSFSRHHGAPGIPRLVLILALLSASTAGAQTAELRELALAIDTRDEGSARYLARALAPSAAPTWRTTLTRIEIAFAATALKRIANDTLEANPRASEPPREALEHVVSQLTRLSSELAALSNALVLEDDPTRAVLRAELAHLRPELERAALLASEALEADAWSTTPELAAEIERWRDALATRLEAWPNDPWPVVLGLWDALDPPPAVAREWPFRSPAPWIGSAATMVLAGAISVLGSLPFFASSRRIPRGLGGSWGLALGSVAGALAGAGWQARGDGFPLVGAALVGLAGLGGVTAVLVLDEPRGRWFGGGLLLGAGIGALWTIGAFAHRQYHRDADAAWRDFLRGLSLTPGPRGLALGWSARF